MGYEVLVVGGGPAGIGAAFAAAREGLKTAIIERHSSLGGNWTNGYVLSILGVYTYDGSEKIVGGVADDVVARLKGYGGTAGKVGNFVPFRPEEMKDMLGKAAKELGIDVYLNTLVSGAIEEGSSVRGITVTGKDGQKRIDAGAFIDASGDADVAQLLGLATMTGKEGNGTHQEATAPFRLANVNEERVIEFAKEHPEELDAVSENGGLSRIRVKGPLVRKAKEEHGLYLPHASSEFLFNTSRKGEFVCNATHVDISDFTSGKQIAEAMEDARDQVISSVEFLTKSIPGFEEAYLMDSSPYIGLRETRRAIGEYVLTKDDVIGNRRFDDAIARCGHPIEIHDPEKGVIYQHLGGGDGSWYHIPYRAIVIKGIDNLFVVGRCLSAEFEAQASARVTGTAMAMGQAAATASRIMIKSNCKARDVNIKELQGALASQGAII